MRDGCPLMAVRLAPALPTLAASGETRGNRPRGPEKRGGGFTANPGSYQVNGEATTTLAFAFKHLHRRAVGRPRSRSANAPVRRDFQAFKRLDRRRACDRRAHAECTVPTKRGRHRPMLRAYGAIAFQFPHRSLKFFPAPADNQERRSAPLAISASPNLEPAYP
jgi:hypothetical protein